MRTARVPGHTELDVEWPQGSAFNVQVQLLRGSVPVDLTAKTVYFTVKERRDLAAPVVVSKSNGPGAHTAPTSGITTFAVATTDFSNYEGPSPVGLSYEVRADDRPYLVGTLRLMPMVGRS